MKFGKKEPELINKNVAKGKIERTPLYKYLGYYITEDGKNQFMIEKRKEKINYMISTTIKYGEMAGELYFQVIIKILETVIIPTLINNAETWTNITNKEMDEIEKMQKTILQGCHRTLKTLKTLNSLEFEKGTLKTLKNLEFSVVFFAKP